MGPFASVQVRVGRWQLIGQAEFDDFDVGFIDGAATKLSMLSLGEQFVYEFDFRDCWTHLWTVGPVWIDPESELGIVPRSPFPYWGWRRSQTSTAAAGTATTGKAPSRRIRV